MRKELKTIEYIERYLLGLMNTDEVDVFEFTMNNNDDFRNEVELQEQLMHSLERISLQQTIQNAQKTYTFWKLVKLIGLILVPILVLITTWFFLNASKEVSSIQQNDTDTQTTLFSENKLHERYQIIPSEIFTIQTEKDTIVETRNGIVLLIPKDAFIDSNQKVVTGTIQLEIKEALDPETIMTAGLSTIYNDKPLETGGMFFIEATKNGKKLQIHPEKEIIADVPTFDYKADMQLFDSEITDDGTINWVNPKPLKKALIPTDIHSLDFYPPNYLDSLSRKGFNSKDKKFTDNVYYSLDYVTKAYNKNTTYFSQEYKIDRLKEMKIPKTDGLNPLKVKTIWNERYQNTFIATKAFEERLAVIHKNCFTANTLLDIYVNNLDSDLYVLDSIAAISAYTGSEVMDMDFYRFTKQRLTNVANRTTDVSKLNDYYLKQQKVYRLALEKSQEKMDSLMNVDRKYRQFSKQQLQDYYSKELAITTKKIAKDLNIRLPRSFNQVLTDELLSETPVAGTMNKEKRKRRYRAPIRTTGWKNIDRIIGEGLIPSVRNRTTATFKNRGKSTTISYSDYEVSIENTERFDKLFVYLVPSEFNSFIKLEAKNDRFTYRLNDVLKYRVYCIAYLNDVPFYFSKTIKNTSDKLTLTKTTTETLREQLSSLNNQNSSLETEVLYQASKKTNERKLKKYRKIENLKKEIKSVVFPCEKYNKPTEVLTDTVEQETEIISTESVQVEEENVLIPFALVESAPIFPGCETFESTIERKKCTSEKIQNFINKEIDMEIISKNQQANATRKARTLFEIDTLGLIRKIQVRANQPDIETEIKRVVQLLPIMKPAIHRGRTVSISYTMPIYASTK